MRRNCHHFSTIRYHETSEKTARMARTNCVSRLDVSTNSHGVVGIAPRTCTSTLASSVTVGVSLMPAPGTAQNLLQTRSEEHTSELQSRFDLVCRLLLEKKKKPPKKTRSTNQHTCAIVL